MAVITSSLNFLSKKIFIMLISDLLLEKVSLCSSKLMENGLKISVAESCTGGILSFLFTYFPNSSKIFDCSFIVYSNSSKVNVLSVKESLIKAYGVVSSQVAIEMSSCAFHKSKSDISVAVTGIAGPQGLSKDKPLGLVYIALLYRRRTICKKYIFEGCTRTQVQLKAAEEALNLIIKVISGVDCNKGYLYD